MESSLFRLFPVLTVLVGGLLLTGCGGGGGGIGGDPAPEPPIIVEPAPATGTFAFVASATGATSAEILVYKIDASGALNRLQSVPAQPGAASVVLHPSKRFAYVVNTSNNSISTYEIDAMTRMLTPRGEVAISNRPLTMSVHPSGEFAYVVRNGASALSILSIDLDTGTLSPAGTKSLTSDAGGIAIDAAGEFLYVGASDGNVFSFAIEATGELIEVNRVATAGGQSRVAIASSGKFLYATHRLSDTLTIHAIDPDTGSLGVPSVMAGIDTPLLVSIDPAGRFTYLANVDDGVVSAYSVDQLSGALTFGATVVSALSSLTVSPSGQFVYLTNPTANSVSVYSVDQETGRLSLLGAPVPVAGSPYGFATVDF